MKLMLPILLAVGFSHSASAFAHPSAIREASDRQLIGVTADEAATLISKLKEAQRRLEAKEFQSFRLLSGSIASYDATQIAPREAFLSVPFDQVWEIRRVQGGDKSRQPFRLAYAPDGLGKLYWDIEVVLNINGGLELVSMTFRPPPPF